MNILSSNYDVIFLGITLISAVLAMFRGAISEILSLSTWFLAFTLMTHYSQLMERFIPQSISNPLFKSIIIFIIAFIIVAICITIIKKIFSSIIKSIGLGGLNIALGFIFGVIRGILICSILVIVIGVLKLDSSHSWQKSIMYPIIAPVVKVIINSIPQQINELPKPALVIPNYN